MIEGLRKMRALLDPSQRRSVFLVVGLMLMMGVMDLAGVASILPFLAVLANPGIIETQTTLKLAYDALGFTSSEAFLRFLGLAVFVVVIFSIAVRALTFYMVTRFTRRTVLNLANALLAHYLVQPYEWFLNRHSADLSKTILAEAGQVVSYSIGPSMRLLANSIVVLLLLGFLLWLQPVVTAITAVLVGGVFGAIYASLRGRLLTIGADRKTAMKERFHVTQEAMTGIKEVKLMGLEDSYAARFLDPSERLARHQASMALVGEMPRYVLEAAAFGGILIFILSVLWSSDGDLQTVLPIIGAFAFAGLKLMPTMQSIFRDVAQIRFGVSALDEIHGELGLSERRVTTPAPGGVAAVTPMGLREAISLRDVTYRYPGADKGALHGLNMAIPARSSVGVVGATGAGKTTLIDIILGLLRPAGGALVVDGAPVTEDNLQAWQRSIGYVPQTIFLADDTIAGNIAFGLPQDHIDRETVLRVGALAKLDEFVDKLPDGYDTRVGEAGVRLSGGQRQRIGIARALYRDPDVIVFDEAMSALDTVTERAVMDAINTLQGQKTLIIITHRLPTIAKCDRIFLLSGGRIEAEGDYDSLNLGNAGFRALAEAAE